MNQEKFIIELRDIHNKILKPTDLVRRVDGNTDEAYGETSPVEIYENEGLFYIRAFVSDYSSVILRNYEFKIEE